METNFDPRMLSFSASPSHPLSQPPTKILLATDLSPRGDRALDRAAQLARQWDAELLIVHAIHRHTTGHSEVRDRLPSWRRPEPTQAIRAQIKRDLREKVDRLQIHIEEGEPTRVILDAVERAGCDLVIVGAERDGLFGRILAESTVENLVRKSPVSVLVVKSRPNGAYRHVLVGTDFTEEARYGLEAAAVSFPDSRFTVMHAFEMPYSAFLSDSALSRESAAAEKTALDAFVENSAMDDAVRAKVRTLVENGSPDVMLCRYVEEQHADLTVIGAYGRGFLYHLLVRGYTPRIVDSVPGDILLIRAHRAEALAIRMERTGAPLKAEHL